MTALLCMKICRILVQILAGLEASIIRPYNTDSRKGFEMTLSKQEIDSVPFASDQSCWIIQGLLYKWTELLSIFLADLPTLGLKL